MAQEIVQYKDRDGQEIKLTPQDVASYCYSGDAMLTDRDVTNFMATCQALGANPYLGDVYLVKYRNSDNAQIMAGKNYYTRVAVSIETFDGMTAGIVCMTGSGELAYRVGSLSLPGDTCIGGWAEVRDKRWSVPARCEVAMSEYNGGRSLWRSKPLTMIRKVALVQALREAYPDRFAGTYDASEMQEPHEPTPHEVTPTVEPTRREAPARPSDEDAAFLKEATARLVELGYDEHQTKAYLWERYKSGGTDEASQAYEAMAAAAAAPEDAAEQPAEPEYEVEDIEF